MVILSFTLLVVKFTVQAVAHNQDVKRRCDRRITISIELIQLVLVLIEYWKLFVYAAMLNIFRYTFTRRGEHCLPRHS